MNAMHVLEQSNFSLLVVQIFKLYSFFFVEWRNKNNKTKFFEDKSMQLFTENQHRF